VNYDASDDTSSRTYISINAAAVGLGLYSMFCWPRFRCLAFWKWDYLPGLLTNESVRTHSAIETIVIMIMNVNVEFLQYP